MIREGYFLAGNTVMTCCEDDKAFIGFLCQSDYVDRLKDKQWITLTAEAHVESRKEYDGESGVVLKAKHIKTAEKPEEELVYF